MLDEALADKLDAEALLIPSLGLRPVKVAIPSNATVAEIVAISLPDPRVNLDRIRVTLSRPGLAEEDHTLIDRSIWHLVRPKPGFSTIVKIVPEGNDAIRTGLILAVTVAAVAAGQIYAPGIALSLFGPSASALLAGSGIAASSTQIALTSAILGAGLATAGGLAINALIPPDIPKERQTQRPQYSISGFRNAANPDGVFPIILGKHRVAPPYIGLPLTEWIGEDQYISAAFLFGYGRLTVTREKLGETLFANFPTAKSTIKEGVEGDAKLNWYPKQVVETAVSAALSHVEPAPVRTVPADCHRASIDISFAQGLVKYKEDGSRANVTVKFIVSYREVGGGAWTDMNFKVTSRNPQPFVKTFGWDFNSPDRGNFEVKVDRTTQDHDTSDNISSRTDWLVLRGFRPEYIINSTRKLAVSGVRIRATAEHNGQLDDYSAVCFSVHKNWKPGPEEWEAEETNNPAALFRGVRQGENAAYPLPDDAFNLENLQEWHQYCTDNSLHFDIVIDYPITMNDLCKMICAAGHAIPIRRNGKWEVVIDREQTEVIAHITSANSWGFSLARSLVETPHAYRIKFFDETRDYVESERVVLWPGFVGVATVFEEFVIPGKTNPAELWRFGRRRQYEVELRRNTYTVSQSWEHLQVELGSLCLLQHPTLAEEMVSGWVRAAAGGSVTIDQKIPDIGDPTDYVFRFRSAADGSTILRGIISMGIDIDDGTQVFALDGGTGGIEEGDLFAFGLADLETREVIVKKIERGQGKFDAQLTLVDHAPGIQHDDEAPEWTGRTGDEPDEGDFDDLELLPPKIRDIASGASALDIDPDLTGTMPIIVILSPGRSERTVTSYRVQHRETSVGGAFTNVDVNVTDDYAEIPDGTYSAGTDIDIQARSIDKDGNVSDPTDIIVFEVDSDN